MQLVCYTGEYPGTHVRAYIHDAMQIQAMQTTRLACFPPSRVCTASHLARQATISMRHLRCVFDRALHLCCVCLWTVLTQSVDFET